MTKKINLSLMEITRISSGDFRFDNNPPESMSVSFTVSNLSGSVWLKDDDFKEVFKLIREKVLSKLAEKPEEQ